MSECQDFDDLCKTAMETIAEMNLKFKALLKENQQLETDITWLIDIIEKQREELKFYGDEENYISPPISQYGSKEAPEIKLDRGQRARSILKLTEE